MGAGDSQARLQRPSADRHPAGRPAGLRQDDRLRQAGPVPAKGRQAARCWSPPTSTVRPPSTSSSRWPSASACRSTRRATDVDPVEIAKDGVAFAREKGDVAIIDTAGRLHIDDELMEELVRIRKEVKPHNILLVVDAMTGQDAVNAAEQFKRARRHRRRRADQARRRRARRRRAVGASGHRQADQVRQHRREARRLRLLPPRPHGLAHPGHGRRADPDREGAGRHRREAGRRAWRSACGAPSSRSRTSSTSSSRCARWARCRASSACCPACPA